MNIPEQGQLVELRHRFFLVQDVDSKADGESLYHKVSLEHLDDDKFGESLEVIWEHEVEVGQNVYTAIEFPEPTGQWDSWDRFQAFLHAISWSTSSFVKGPELMAPFQSAIEILPHQLEPVVRALQMPRVNLLIADDVGLGKTIEAGLVAQELLSRQVIRKILIICPASLQKQWKEEMASKFQLDFRIIDRQEMQHLRKEYGIHVNPWNSYPRLITSMDFLKREHPLQKFRASLKRDDQRRFLKSWDMLILDEAHNVAPSGRKTYIQDSDRTKMMKEIMDDFDHRLFLTATPHNGYTHSFTALLELLDPARFCRSDEVDTNQVKRVMVRRLKEHVEDALGEKIFPERKIKPLELTLPTNEDSLFKVLNNYIKSRLAHKNENLHPVKFALTMLKKRLLSSTFAFSKSIDAHIRHLQEQQESLEKPDIKLVEKLVDETKDDWDNDYERQRLEDDALQEATRFFTGLSDEENDMLKEMSAISGKLAKKQDAKTKHLINWIEENYIEDGKWIENRLIIFTEYKDTLSYLSEIFEKKGWHEQIIHLYGGMASNDREIVKAAFQENPKYNNVRILLSTDAASEGLNLQNHCNKMIHYEIPWNPNRLEQRNGRIDRQGQKADEVIIHHFTYMNNEDSEFLEKIVEKVQTIRHDLGSMGNVIAQNIEERMLGSKETLKLELKNTRKEQVIKETEAEIITKHDIAKIRSQLNHTIQTWGLNTKNMSRVLEMALQIDVPMGSGNYLIPVETGELKGHGYRLLRLPGGWDHLGKYISNPKGERLTIVFDHEKAKSRNDVVLLHLNHPLMKKAFSIFRKNIWSIGITKEQKLNRLSYKILSNQTLQDPTIIAFSRLIALSENGEKLHEEIISYGFTINKEHLEPIEDSDSKKLLESEGEFRSIPSSVGESLKRLYPSHKLIIEKMQKNKKKEIQKEILKLLKERAKKDAKEVEILLKEREKEIIANIEKQTSAQKTLADYDLIEKSQFEDDIRWLKRRLETIREQQKIEPERVRNRFSLRDTRIFPLGLVYLLPEKMMEEK